jgi:hypothetical protein
MNLVFHLWRNLVDAQASSLINKLWERSTGTLPISFALTAQETSLVVGLLRSINLSALKNMD